MRTRIRSGQQQFELWSSNGPLGPRFMRRISFAKGEAMVASGEAIRYSSPDTGDSLGYQIVAANYVVMNDSSPSSKPSCTAFSRAEVEAVVGLRGPSRTARLSDVERARRVLNGHRSEDLVEAAQNKLAAYRSTH